MERWKPIIGWEDKYAISDQGRVKNIITGQEIPQHDNGIGYKKVHLWRNGVGETRCYVHRIVAEVFLGKNEKRTEVNHKDGNPSNNDLSNLEWVTSGENTKHAIYRGTLCAWGNKAKPIEGTNILTGEVKRFATISEAERTIGSKHICNVLKGQRKKCKGYTFRYLEPGGDDDADFEYIQT